MQGNIIKADGQLFRIYHKVKNLDGIQVNARHIFYDLMDNFLEDVKVTNLSGLDAMDFVLTHTQYAHPFSCIGDVGGSATAEYVKKNVVEAIMSSDNSDSQQNSLLVNYGGELVRDNFTIEYKQHRGEDKGVNIRYGKNITGIEETLDMDNVVTRLMPIGKDGLLLDERYIDSLLINNYSHPIVKSVEFSDDDCQDALRADANKYLNSGVDIPTVNYEVNFIELAKTEEYKSYAVLESVYMGDTVTIRHERLGIDIQAEVIRIKKNVITGRIEEVELGSFKRDLSDTFSGISSMADNLQLQVNKANDNLQEQVDGKIETYYTDEDPHQTWPVSDYNMHNGDIWYSMGTKQLFRFSCLTGVWEEIKSQKAIDAYDAAKKAQDTADSKRRIFTATPIVPYDEGDLWVQGSKGDILVCKNAKSNTQTYDSDDWELASKYTDDKAVNEFVTGAYKTDKDNLQSQIDREISTWFYSGIPTLNNEPADAWIDNDTKKSHIGDLYYDTDPNNQTTKHAYRFALVDGVYQWLLITDTDISTALDKAKNAQDTADHKRRVFILKPSPPYDIGDLWMEGPNGDILTCQNAKVSGSYADGDFQKLNKYTDDTYAKNIQIGGRNLLRNTNNFKDLTNWFLSMGSGQNGSLEIVVDAAKGSVIHASKTNNASWWVIENLLYNYLPQKFDTSKQYTISFDVKSKNSGHLFVAFMDASGINQVLDNTDLGAVPTTWTRVTKSFTPVTTGNNPCLYITGDVNSDEYWITNIKLEQSSKPTDYTEAPEDTQARIDSAQKAADDANTVAGNAQKDASKAISSLDDMADDSRLTAVEKMSVQQNWNAILSEKSTIDGQADHYEISKSAYDNAYVTLQSYITPLIADITTTSDIDKNTFDNNFVSYYNAKNALFQAIVQKAKDNLDNLQIGGRNLLLNSGWQKDTSHWLYSSAYSLDTSVKFDNQNTMKINVSGNTSEKDYSLYNQEVLCNAGDVFTASVYFMSDNITTIDGNKFYLEINYLDSNSSVLDWSGISSACPSQNNMWQRFSFTLKAPANAVRVRFSVYLAQNGRAWIAKPKLERGDKMTDWAPAPEDVQGQIDNLNNFVNVTYSTDKLNMQKAIDNATSQMSSALGGYVYKRNGELLIMDTPDVNTATKVWRWNQNGLAYSSSGYNGTYTTAITADGHIVADFITTGNLSASLIKGGELTLGGSGNGNGSELIKDSAGNTGITLDQNGFVMDVWYNGTTPTNGFYIRNGVTKQILMGVDAGGQFTFAGVACFKDLDILGTTYFSGDVCSNKGLTFSNDINISDKKNAITSDLSGIKINGNLLTDMSDFIYSHGTNGYQKFPSGIIIQWGTYYGSLGSYHIVTFPIAFPNADVAVVATPHGYNTSFTVDSLGLSSFQLYVTGSGINVSSHWIAIGY